MILHSDRFEEYLYCQGRRYVEDGRLFLNHSGASAKGLFRGSVLVLKMESKASERGRNAYIRFTIDGKHRRIRMPNGSKTLLTAVGEGEHTFEVIKLTETANNTFALLSCETDGRFLPYSEQKDLKIEFIGDSISTGFGVLCPNEYGEYQTKEQDETKAFPYLTACALNAEYHVIAAGGWPIYKSKYAPYAIPDYYDNTDLFRNFTPWDHGSFRPDLRVVTLGTNDFSYLADLPEDVQAKEREEVKKRFVAFVKKLLCLGGKIILVYGFFEYPDLGVLTEEVKKEIDSPDLYTLQVQSAASLSDVRAGHPGKKTHRKAFQKLSSFIKRIL
ncbi:MAG TPA: hypothetical protein DIC18_03725 [Clostridiales bacterium]|nr:hypothetical protein [Clostridiales bacterium]